VKADATASATARAAGKPAREEAKLEKRLMRLVGQAIGDFRMIDNGDKVMVCLSGGKDSYSLLEILLTLRETGADRLRRRRRQPRPEATGLPGPRASGLLAAARRALSHRDAGHLLDRDARHPGRQDDVLAVLKAAPRRAVSRRRRTGRNQDCARHHRDDILGTFFLNLFYGGRIKGMPPKLVSDDGRNVVIRPLAYVHEADLARFAQVRQFPIIPCNLCGSQDNLKRQEVKRMLADWERRYPGRVMNSFNALSRVVPSHLMDRNLHDFAGLRPSGRPQPDGDIAFDEEPCAAEDEPTAGVIRFAEAE